MPNNILEKQDFPLECQVSIWPAFLTEAEARDVFDEIVEGYDVSDSRILMEDGSYFESDLGVFTF